MFEVFFLEDTAEQLKNLTVPSVLWSNPHLHARNARILLSVADSKPFISYSVAFPVVLVLLGGAFIILYFWYRKHQQLITSRRRIAREVARHYTSMPNQDALSKRKQEHLEALRIVKKMLEEHPSSKVLKSELHNTLTGLYHVEKLLYEAMQNPAAAEVPRNAFPAVRYSVDLNLQSLSASKHPSTVGSIVECSNRTPSPASTSAPPKVRSWSPVLHTTGGLAAFHIVDGRVEPAKIIGDDGGSHPLASASQTARTVSLELSANRGFEKRKNESDIGIGHGFWKKSKVAGAEATVGQPASESRKMSMQAEENVVVRHNGSARSSLASDAGILGLAFASLLASNFDTGQSSQTVEESEDVPQETSLAAEQIGESKVPPTAQDMGFGEPNVFANLHEGTAYFDNSPRLTAGSDDADLSERRIASAEQNSMASEEVLEYGSSRLTGPGSANWDWSSAGPEDFGNWSPLNVVTAEQGHNSTPFAQTEEKRLYDRIQEEVRAGSCFSNFRKVCYLCGERSMPPPTVDQSPGPGLTGGSLELVTIENPLFVPNTGDHGMPQEEPDRTLPFFATLEQLFSRGKQLLFETKSAPQRSPVSKLGGAGEEIAPAVSVHVDSEPHTSWIASMDRLPVRVSYEEGGFAPIQTKSAGQHDDLLPADVCNCERQMSLQAHGLASDKQLRSRCYNCGKPRANYAKGLWVCRSCGKRMARGMQFCECREMQDGDHHSPQHRIVEPVGAHRDCFTQTSLWGAWGPPAFDMYHPSEDPLVKQVSHNRGGGGALQMADKAPSALSCKEVQKPLQQHSRPVDQSTSQNVQGRLIHTQCHQVASQANVHVSHRLRDGRFARSRTGSGSLHQNWPKLSDSEVSSLYGENDNSSTKYSTHEAQEDISIIDDLGETTKARRTEGSEIGYLEHVEDNTPSGHPEGISLKDYVEGGKTKDEQVTDQGSPSGSSSRLSHPEVSLQSDENYYISSSKSSAHGAQQDTASIDDIQDNTKSGHSEEASFIDYINDAVTTLVLPGAPDTYAGTECRQKDATSGSLDDVYVLEDDTQSGHPEGISLSDYEEISRVHVDREKGNIPTTRSSGCQTTFTSETSSHTDERRQIDDNTCEPVVDPGDMSGAGVDCKIKERVSTPYVDKSLWGRYMDPADDEDTCTTSRDSDDIPDKAVESSEAANEKVLDVAGETSISLAPRVPSEDAPEEVLLRLLEEPLRSPTPEGNMSYDEVPPTPDAAKVVLDILEGELVELGAIGCMKELDKKFPSSPIPNQSGEASSELPQVNKSPVLGDGTIFVKPIMERTFGMEGIRTEWHVSTMAAHDSEAPALHGNRDTARHNSSNSSTANTSWDRVSPAAELVSVAGTSTDVAELLRDPKEDHADTSRCQVEPLNEQLSPSSASVSTLNSASNVSLTVDNTACVGKVPNEFGMLAGTFSMGSSIERVSNTECAPSRLQEGELDQEPALLPCLSDTGSSSKAETPEPGNAPDDCRVDSITEHAAPKAPRSVEQIQISGVRADISDSDECVEQETEYELQGKAESAACRPDACTTSHVRSSDPPSSVGSEIRAPISGSDENRAEANLIQAIKMPASTSASQNHGHSVVSYFHSSAPIENQQNNYKKVEPDERKGSTPLSGERDQIVDLRDVYRRSRRRRLRRVEEPISCASHVVPVSPAFNDDRHTVMNYLEATGTPGFLEMNQEYRNMDGPGVAKTELKVQHSLDMPNVDAVQEDAECAGEGSSSQTPFLDLREVCGRPQLGYKRKTLPQGLHAVTLSNAVQSEPDPHTHMKQANRECVERSKISGDKEQEPGQEDNILASEFVEGTLVIEKESRIILLDFERRPASPGKFFSLPTTSAGEGGSDTKQKEKGLAAREPWKFEKKFDMFSSDLVLSSKHPPARTKAVRKLEKDLMEELQRQPPLRCFPTLSRIELLHLLKDRKSTRSGRTLSHGISPYVKSNAELHRKRKLQQKLSYGNVKL